MFRLSAAALVAASLALCPATPASAQTSITPSARAITGTVLDPSGAPIAGAGIVVTNRGGGPLAKTTTGGDGSFMLPWLAEAYQIAIDAPGFETHTATLADMTAATSTFTLTIDGVQEAVRVEGAGGYGAAQVDSATRTPTPLRDVPQSVSIVTRELMADQAMLGIADVVRYLPGVGIAQGEGNRDTPVLRGQSTTADFFVDGVRDDVQYMRDLYNVESVEALKGANALVFGRGGAGGVINRVTRRADWGAHQEVTLQTGSWNQRRLSGDAGWTLSPSAAARVTAVYENSDSYREGVGVTRYGVNPTGALKLGARTIVRAGYEFFHDERTADRGVSSFDGRPLVTDPSVFFGDPSRSPVRATANVAVASLDHQLAGGGSLRSRVSVGVYDKFYQNVFPGSVNGTGGTVQLSAYNNATDRTNVFSQTDVVLRARTGALRHMMLVGMEIGRQVTDNVRNTGYFDDGSRTSIEAPLSRPAIDLPITFRQSATDADNHGIATTAALFAQDQVQLTQAIDLVLGLRVERFGMELTNNRTGQVLSSTDTLVSPRAGVIYKPASAMSLYGSYSLSHLPRAGEQLSSLSATNEALAPETFRNYEAGAKWDLRPSLGLTMAVYRLDRGNVAVVDPADPTRSILVDAQRTRGLEVGLNGAITRAWTVAGGYALQDGEITRAISSSAQAGAELAQLPRHSLSLWSKYQLHRRFAAGLGIIHRGSVYTSTDNAVVVPSFTRADAGLFYDVTPRLRAQMNVENLTDVRYFASAHSNTNITPGSPRAVRLTMVIRP